MAAEAGKTERKRWHLSTPSLVALVALASGIVTLAFTLAPSLKPDPGNAISATARVITVEPHASYAKWAARPGSAARADSSLASERDGFVAYVELEVNGRKRRGLQLRQSLYLVRSGRRYESYGETVGFRSDTPSDRFVASIFVVNPGLAQRFFVRFELFDGGVMLAVADTRPLPATSTS